MHRSKACLQPADMRSETLKCQSIPETWVLVGYKKFYVKFYIFVIINTLVRIKMNILHVAPTGNQKQGLGFTVQEGPNHKSVWGSGLGMTTPIRHRGFASSRSRDDDGARGAQGREGLHQGQGLILASFQICEVQTKRYRHHATSQRTFAHVDVHLLDIHRSIRMYVYIPVCVLLLTI